MRAFLRAFAPLILLLLPAPLSAAQRAFVVGINRYEHFDPHRQLVTAVADAKAVARTLRALNFEVTEVTSASDTKLSGFWDKFDRFALSIQKDDTVLFYFAGHGIQRQGKNYLLPSDAERPDQSEGVILSRSFDFSAMMEKVAQREPRRRIAILDACRTDPYQRGARNSAGGGLAAPTIANETFYLYSAADGQEALDAIPGEKDPSNSPFTRVLLGALSEKHVTLDAMARQVRVKLRAQLGTRHPQTPHYYDGLIEQYCLNGGCERPLATAPTVPSSPPVPAPGVAAAAVKAAKAKADEEAARARAETEGRAKSEAEARSRAEAEARARVELPKSLVPLPPADGWVLLGSLNKTSRISVGRDHGGWSAILLKAKDGTAFLEQIAITYGNGEVHVVPVGRDVVAGSHIGPIDLKSAPRIIENIDLHYRSRSLVILGSRWNRDPDGGEVWGYQRQTPTPAIVDWARPLQVELQRVGCLDDAPDGKWGEKSGSALDAFLRNTNITGMSAQPSEALVARVKTFRNRVCPCPDGMIEKSGDCVVKPTPKVSPPTPTQAKVPVAKPQATESKSAAAKPSTTNGIKRCGTNNTVFMGETCINSSGKTCWYGGGLRAVCQ